MKQYENYRDSGIEWLGNVPSHWGVICLKNMANILNGNGFPHKYQGNQMGDIPFLKVSDINDIGNYVQASNNYVSFELAQKENWSIIPVNSILTAKIGNALLKNHRKINLSNCIIDNNMLAISFNKFNLYKSYLFKLINFNMFVQEGAIPSVNIDLLKNLKLPIPPIEEQEKITSYLDHKVDIVDKLILKKKKQVELFKENKQAIINDVVLKGLNPDVEFKDTNIKYMGKIPKHWDITKLKYLISINNGQDYKHIQTDNKHAIEVIGSGGVFAYSKEYLYNGKALLLGRKGTIDKPLYVNQKFWVVDTMFYCTSKNINTCIKYLYYISLNFPFMLYSTSTALPSMAKSDIETHKIQFPPLAEQEEIAKYLDRKTSIIDQLIEKVNQSIELLEEYKTSLISHIVTGKIKV